MANNVDYSKNSPNYTANAQVRAAFGMPRSIDWITIHWWGDPNTNPSYEGVVSWLCNTRSQVSAHDVITGTGNRVAVLVDYNNAAWHAGSAQGNATSLGFECDPRARNEDYEAVAQDIAETWKYYGRIIPLRAHNSWSSTRCPGTYDLGRLHNRAVEIMNGAPAPAKATTAEIQQAYRDILEREADQGGINTYLNTGWNIDKIRSDLNNSQEKKDLEARKAAEYAKNEWVRNLAPYVEGSSDYSQGKELLVLPAEGLKRYNLENGSLYNNEVIPRGTSITIVAKTSVNGTPYYISSSSKKSGIAVGLRADQLGEPATPPVQEKPEWLKNLQDIEDKDMWTRSATPVLDLENGSVVTTYPMNKKIRVTHATEIVGKDLLVLEGGKLAIEVLYASDTEIKNPNDDLEKRLTLLEAIVKSITDFLTSIFANFKK